MLRPKAGIISTGNELIYGTTLDTNSSYMSGKLFAFGCDVRFHLTVGDNKEDLEAALRESVNKTDIVFITGGLGPTDDDNTIEVLQRIYGFSTCVDEAAKRKMESFFSGISRPVGEKDIKMVTVPRDAAIIENNTGLAPGFMLNFKGTRVIALPGVPGEMTVMFEKNVLPFLEKQYRLEARMSLFIPIVGMKESDINKRVNSILETNAGILQGITWGMTAKEGVCTISFVQTGEGEKSRSVQAKEVVLQEAERLFGEQMLLPGCNTPEEELVYLLKKEGMSISLAEGMTGGDISGRISAVPGASAVFSGSIIAYSNDSKISELGVSPETISRYGAVSEEVVREMVQGVTKKFGTAIGIAVTGIAGPGGEALEKETGTACFAFSLGENIRTATRKMRGHRTMVKRFASLYAVDSVRIMLRRGEW
ncbi:MAG: CinA family nicotinamide mononucleotide deamidase-related protein [bacterium]|nr:CinA family nicotinamide mononucleotide deamidase-related protein [bacterium]